jgi:hypothetical protein
MMGLSVDPATCIDLTSETFLVSLDCTLSQLMYTHRGVQNAASATYEVALQAAHSFSQLLAPDILHSRTFLRACGH